MPALDSYEPNDDAGARAWTIGRGRSEIRATVDYWDDRVDVYRVQLRRGEQLRAKRDRDATTPTQLSRCGSPACAGSAGRAAQLRAAQSARRGALESIRYRAPKAGWYFLQVAMSREAAGPYSLTLTRG